MADELSKEGMNPEVTGEGNADDSTNNGGNTENELRAKLAELEEKYNQMMVEKAKSDRQSDKNAKEAKEWKEKYRSTQSEKEVMDAEKAEAIAQREAEFESMKKTIQIQNLTENFMDMGYSKELAKKAATAQADNDTQTLLDIQKQFNEAQKKAWEAEFLKNRPDVNIGGTSGKAYTKEQFDAMSLIDRTKLKRENPSEYDRLMKL